MSWYRNERGWMDSPFFAKVAYSERDAWQWLIGEAAYKDIMISVDGRPFNLLRGQLYVSIRFLSTKFQWSKDKTSRFLRRLEKWQMIVTDSDTGQTRVTICNYCKYQDGQDTTRDTSKDRVKDTPKDKQEEVQEGKEGRGEPKPKPKKNGSRIPEDWDCSSELGKWAMSQGLTREKVLYEIEQFTDHWRAATGKGSVAMDWNLKFKTWIRNSIKWAK